MTGTGISHRGDRMEVDGSFAGEAGRTLDYIEQQVVPQLDIQSQANRPLYIMGYSLAGLFALWAMYQTDIFAGCATCSGSMWYPGFTEYVNSQPTLANKPYIHQPRRQGIADIRQADVNCCGSDQRRFATC